jgi:hypothetical protein
MLNQRWNFVKHHFFMMRGLGPKGRHHGCPMDPGPDNGPVQNLMGSVWLIMVNIWLMYGCSMVNDG